MEYNSSYKGLKQQTFSKGEYSLVPIRYEDRMDIMRWRNEQVYHLRQNEPLTEERQEWYFKEVVAKLFQKGHPDQILFSYLKGTKCIGYGGLVHINWIDKNAEISFIMDTSLEKEEFEFHWQTYLSLIEQVAFNELALHKIYTYAFDLRPHLYQAIEKVGYNKEAILKEHCFFEGNFKDVIIHSKYNKNISFRKVSMDDMMLVYEWATEKGARENSFFSKEISIEEHKSWFKNKVEDKDSQMLIAMLENKPIALVRYDKIENNLTVGINIDKKYRGKSLGVDLLVKSREELEKEFVLPILAYIKKENIASIKTFEKAGYIYFTESEVNGQKCLVYKYE
mgnify:CR=1 FL=1